jgi:hypothetical protein
VVPVTQLPVPTWRSARRSRSSWSNFTSSRSSSHTTMARLPDSKKASSKLPVRAIRWRRWNSRMLRGRSRPSTTTLTLTLATTSVKTLCQAVAAAAPTPRVVPHRKWMETLIGFYASDYPKNMAGARQLPLLVSLTITNVRLSHVLIDGGAVLNLISLVAFHKLRIPMSRLSPSHPFLGVSTCSIILRGSISLLVTFRTPENYRTESDVFDVTEVNLPFNTIIDRSAMYQFMAVTHYGYLVLKMSSPNSIIKNRGDRSVGVSTLAPTHLIFFTPRVALGQ